MQPKGKGKDTGMLPHSSKGAGKDKHKDRSTGVQPKGKSKGKDTGKDKGCAKARGRGNQAGAAAAGEGTGKGKAGMDQPMQPPKLKCHDCNKTASPNCALPDKRCYKCCVALQLSSGQECTQHNPMERGPRKHARRHSAAGASAAPPAESRKPRTPSPAGDLRRPRMPSPTGASEDSA